jgi:ribosomal protein S18 acetylase RimI-like enzyme
VSVTVQARVVPPGSREYLEAAWELKERIRKEESLLKQRRGFFADAYQRSTVHVLLDGPDDHLVGFAAARRDGYILFLAIEPDRRGEGLGERLVARVAQDNASISCHARTDNENALEFYGHLGFETVRRIPNYYEDGDDALYLKLGDTHLIDRLSDFLRR